VAEDGLAAWWGPVPAFIDVAGETGSADHVVAFATSVKNLVKVVYGSVNELVGSVGYVSWVSACYT